MRFGSIRGRILRAFLSIVLTFAVLTALASSLTSFRVGMDRSYDQLASVLTLKANELNLWAEQLENSLDYLAWLGAVHEPSVRLLSLPPSAPGARSLEDGLEGELQGFVVRTAIFSDLCLLDGQGQFRITLRNGLRGQNAGSAPYFLMGLQKNYIAAPCADPVRPETLVIAASHPIVGRGTGSLGVLVGFTDLAFVNAIMREPMGLGESGESYLVGGKGEAITPLRGPIPALTVPRPDEGARRAVEDKVSGQAAYLNYRGVPVMGAYSWLPSLQIGLVVEESRAELFAPVNSIIIANVGVTLAVLFLALLGASGVARSISVPLAELSGTARLIAEGELGRKADTGRDDEIGALARAFDHMTERLNGLLASQREEIAERKKAEALAHASLAEKDTLLRELHHRTKNNMGVISALLDLQAEETEDERLRDAFALVRDRIASMSLVHKKLYETGDLSHLDLGAYLSELAHMLVEGHSLPGNRPLLEESLETIPILIDFALPCGLAVNELMTNALKYGRLDSKPVRLRLSLRREANGCLCLVVADEGPGFPPGFDPRRDGRMGMRTVLALVENQLGGKVEFAGPPGVACILRFPHTEGKVRV